MNEPLPILRASPTREAGLDATTLRRRTRLQGPGRLVRAGPNAFVDGAAWDAAGPRQRYVTRVYARLGRLGSRATASHDSAAAVHGLPALGGWSVPVHATVPESMYRGRTPELVLHTRPVSGAERVRVGDLAVTAVPRTVIDIAMSGDLRTGVVVADAALRNGTERDELWRAVHPSARGRARAAQVLDLADGRSGSPAESLARVVFRELGLPAPVLQQEFVVDGRRSAVDFWFPAEGVVVEIDGRAKYTQDRYLGGRSQTEVFLDEKRRHARLLTVPGVRTIIRLEWRDLFDLDALALRFRAAGLPCAIRPVRSARRTAVGGRR
ncbi:hypothetical protein EDF52_10490 [Curtobacterium sp. PhB42]|uniref:hypothetical protein n=1 Tax=unclassified Curtobacterium TaxID=257496 RepID=UPI00106350A1|nr:MULTISPECIES: hypothetical protein [unclassified Curtobacterium]TDW49316.1 hypothetical protein EDF52_10490 [Curtobacterium sp. PhB42]TDW56647.1 hypothetical protein EDF47_103233 [Curtobacterium sp. PhB190]